MKNTDQQAKKQEKEHTQKIRINTIIDGEPATWLGEWKQRGLITSYSDGIIQALKAYYEKQLEQDLKKAKITTLTQYNP